VAAVKLLSRLEPKPGRLYAGDDPQYITPDVYIVKVGEAYHTVLNDDGLSKLRISQHYRMRCGTAPPKGDQGVHPGEAALGGVADPLHHQRQRTIVKVTDSIIKFQRDFLDKGIAYLKRSSSGRGRGHRHARVDRLARDHQQVRAHAAGDLRAEVLLQLLPSRAWVARTSPPKPSRTRSSRSCPASRPTSRFSDQKIVEILRSQTSISRGAPSPSTGRSLVSCRPAKRKRFF